MRFLFWSLLLLYIAVIPTTLCVLFERHPGWFRGIRLLGWIPALSLLSWSGVVGAILIPARCGLWVPRGPELAFALLFGWLYLWIAGFPVFLMYGIIRRERRLLSEKSQRTDRRRE